MSNKSFAFKCPHCGGETLVSGHKTIEYHYLDEEIIYDSESNSIEVDMFNSCEPPGEDGLWELAFYMCYDCGAKWHSDAELIKSNALVEANN